MQTKFSEVVVRTSVLEEMVGKYFAERVLRTWKEDFVDEGTSEVISMTRNEVLFYRGVEIDNHVLSQINFWIQSGDIKDVLVSNQKRTGVSVKTSSSVYCVTVLSSGKKRNYYLYANSVEMATKIMNDFLEQKIEGGFSFVAAKEIGYSNLIPLVDEDASDLDFYKVEVDVSYEEDEPFNQVYILQANDAEDAKEIIIKFISLRMEKENNVRPFEVTILSARTIPCNNIVDYDFVKEYFDNNLN